MQNVRVCNIYLYVPISILVMNRLTDFGFGNQMEKWVIPVENRQKWPPKSGGKWKH